MVTASGACVTVAVRSAVPIFPDPSSAVAVQITVVSSVTDGAVKVLPEKLPPFVQLNVGVVVTFTLSVTVKLEVPVLPDTTVKLAGAKDNTGAVVSGVIETDRTAVEALPAASLTVAVHSLVVELVTIGAVNVPAENTPPFVHVVVGPELMPTLSEAVKFEIPELPPTRDNDVGLKAIEGAVVSATGGGGGGGGVTTAVEDDPPPPQVVNPKAINAIKLTCIL